MEKSERYFRDLLEKVRLIAVILDGNGCISYCNPYLLELTGYISEELIGADWFQKMVPKTNSDTKKVFIQGLQSGDIAPYYENPIKTHEGTIRHIVWNNTILLNDEGKIIGTASIGEDITERKNAEEKLRSSSERYKSLFENNPQPMWIYDIKTLAFLEVNEAAVVQYEYSKEEFLSMTLRDIRPEEDISALLVDVKATTRTYNKAGIWRHRKKSGDIIFVEIISHEIVFEEKPARLVLANNVTEQKRVMNELEMLYSELEMRVKERTAQLLALNKELETFTYSVSHDLKAPLRAIDGYSKLLLDSNNENLGSEQLLFLRNIRNSTIKMSQLIDDLLEFSRLERSHMKSEKIRIVDLITSVISIYREELISSAFSLETDVKDIEISADSKGLTIALRNLLGNAIKFTRNRPSPVIKIRMEENASSWILSVSDNGIGFDMKYHHKIFEIFQRLHKAEDFPGTGIGLALVSKAMQRMHGKVWAESIFGTGSVFYLEIPK